MAVVVERVIVGVLDEVPELVRPGVLEVFVVVEAGVDDRDADVVAGRGHVVGAEDLEQRVGRARSVSELSEAANRGIRGHTLDVRIGRERGQVAGAEFGGEGAYRQQVCLRAASPVAKPVFDLGEFAVTRPNDDSRRPAVANGALQLAIELRLELDLLPTALARERLRHHAEPPDEGGHYQRRDGVPTESRPERSRERGAEQD